eukprot:TRINITY_DN3133_c0_g1_i1.p1 TRINITY_DN3133_c0_g1~~TRINITY_DN3133_c0_g1_i1.p1  ORF type:complete len:235 (+),score=29.05 TRINITY_DN3133_c0_g1_i1:27-731(+)
MAYLSDYSYTSASPYQHAYAGGFGSFYAPHSVSYNNFYTPPVYSPLAAYTSGYGHSFNQLNQLIPTRHSLGGYLPQFDASGYTAPLGSYVSAAAYSPFYSSAYPTAPWYSTPFVPSFGYSPAVPVAAPRASYPSPPLLTAFNATTVPAFASFPQAPQVAALPQTSYDKPIEFTHLPQPSFFGQSSFLPPAAVPPVDGERGFGDVPPPPPDSPPPEDEPQRQLTPPPPSHEDIEE